MKKHPTGSTVFDDMLCGGYESGILTTIYGPAGVGKSNLMLLAVASSQEKVIFIDTEGSFSIERLSQFAPDVEKILDRTVVLRARSMEEQTTIIEKLPAMMKNVSLIIIDSIATQYRVALARKDSEVNNSLSTQMNVLYTLASDYDIPVLLTSQVYADMETEGIKVIGGDIVKYNSKCLIELQYNEKIRKAILIRHRSLPTPISREFIIDSVGIYEVEK